jgi:hypothetical protein
MCRELGFTISSDTQDAGIAVVSLDLATRRGASAGGLRSSAIA